MTTAPRPRPPRADLPRRGSRILAVAAMGMLLTTISGCQYRLAGSRPGSIPDNVEFLVVAPFENRTTRPEIEQRVTENVALELSRRGRYKVITDGDRADALLEGAITSYRTAPVEFGDELVATRMEAVVTLQATLREVETDQVLWSQAGLVFRGQFEVQDEAVFFEQESVALDDIAKGAADALVTSIFEGF